MRHKLLTIILILLVVITIGNFFLMYRINDGTTSLHSVTESVLEESKEMGPPTSKTTPDYVEMLTIAKSVADTELAKLMFLNVINNNPENIEYSQEYLGFLQRIQAPENDYQYLSSLLYLSMLQASQDKLPVIYDLYSAVESIIQERFIQESFQLISFSEDEKSIQERFTLKVEGVLDKWGNGSIPYNDASQTAREILDLYYELRNPTVEQQNIIERIQTAVELLESQELILVLLSNTLEYDNQLFLDSYEFISQQYYSSITMMARYQLDNQALAKDSIKERAGAIDIAMSLINQRYTNLQIDSVDQHLQKLVESLESTQSTNQQKMKELEEFQLFIQQRQSLSLDPRYMEKIQDSISFTFAEMNKIERDRLRKYQYWTYQTILDAENLLSSVDRRTDFEALGIQLNNTGFFKVDTQNLIGQILVLYDDVYKKVMKQYEKPEHLQIIREIISINLKSGLKSLENF